MIIVPNPGASIRIAETPASPLTSQFGSSSNEYGVYEVRSNVLSIRTRMRVVATEYHPMQSEQSDAAQSNACHGQRRR